MQANRYAQSEVSDVAVIDGKERSLLGLVKTLRQHAFSAVKRPLIDIDVLEI